MLTWNSELNTGKDNKFLRGIAGDDVCILAPRGSSKSTYLLQWTAWIIGTHAAQNVSLKILYISYVVDVASSKSRQIKAIIESKRYQEVFPHIKPNKKKWGESEWAIDFEHAGLPTMEEPYTLACSGLGGAINSKRSNLLIFDDLLKSPSEAKNKKIQDRMLENYYNIVQYTKHDGARSINLGTRMAKFDIYATAFIAPRWKVIKQSALLTIDGVENSYCDKRVGLSTLQTERETDYDSFLLQRQNEIPETTSQGIQFHDIRFDWMPSKFDRIIIGLDTADSIEANSNATAAIVVGIYNDRLYVITGYEGRIRGNSQKIDLIYDLWSKYQSVCKYPAILAVDWHSHVKSIEADFQVYQNDIDEDSGLDDRFKKVGVEKVKSSGRGEKIDRIESHSYLFERARIFFNRISPVSEIDKSELFGSKEKPGKLIKQLTDHNPLDHNDPLDALEVAVFVARTYISQDISAA